MTIKELASDLYDLSLACEKDLAIEAIVAVLIDKIPNRECEQCKMTYVARVSWQRFCSEQCKLDWHEEKHGKPFIAKAYNQAIDMKGRIRGTGLYARKINDKTVLIETLK